LLHFFSFRTVRWSSEVKMCTLPDDDRFRSGFFAFYLLFFLFFPRDFDAWCWWTCFIRWNVYSVMMIWCLQMNLVIAYIWFCSTSSSVDDGDWDPILQADEQANCRESIPTGQSAADPRSRRTEWPLESADDQLTHDCSGLTKPSGTLDVVGTVSVDSTCLEFNDDTFVAVL